MLVKKGAIRLIQILRYNKITWLSFHAIYIWTMINLIGIIKLLPFLPIQDFVRIHVRLTSVPLWGTKNLHPVIFLQRFMSYKLLQIFTLLAIWKWAAEQQQQETTITIVIYGEPKEKDDPISWRGRQDSIMVFIWSGDHLLSLLLYILSLPFLD